MGPSDGSLSVATTFLPSLPHRLGKADGRGGLALAGRGWRDAGYDDHLAAPSVVADGVESYLGLVVAVGDKRVGAESQVLCNVHDGPHTITSGERRVTAGAGLPVDGANCSISVYVGKLGRLMFVWGAGGQMS